MRAVILNCTLKASPAPSNTQELAGLRERGVDVESIRVVDRNVPPGVETDLGDGDDWPAVHEKMLLAEILVIASPTWVGRPSSVAQRVLERMDGNMGPGPGPDYSDTDHGHQWSAVAAATMAGNLYDVADALRARPMHGGT